MSKQVSLENTLAGGFGLPTGQIVTGNGSIVVEPEVWDACKDHPVVKARVEAGTLIVDGKGKKKSADDDSGDTAELRKQFDDSIAALNTELDAEKAKVAERDTEIANLKAKLDGGNPPPTYEARDKGAGWWAIYDADSNEIGASIRKDDAEAFNAMSNEDKAAFVKSEASK